MAKQAYAEKGYLAAYKIARRKKKMLPLAAQRWASKVSGYTPVGLRKRKAKPLSRTRPESKPKSSAAELLSRYARGRSNSKRKK